MSVRLSVCLSVCLSVRLSVRLELKILKTTEQVGLHSSDNKANGFAVVFSYSQLITSLA